MKITDEDLARLDKARLSFKVKTDSVHPLEVKEEELVSVEDSEIISKSLERLQEIESNLLAEANPNRIKATRANIREVLLSLLEDAPRLIAEEPDLAEWHEAYEDYMYITKKFRPSAGYKISEEDFEELAKLPESEVKKVIFKPLTYMELLEISDAAILDITKANIAILEEAHDSSSNHREQLEAGISYGCFYCISIFYKSTPIKEWVDKNTTALCPKCGIDSILPKSQSYPLTSHFLSAMHDYWFERSSKMEQ